MPLAVYPNNIQTFTQKIDNVDPVMAADVNTVYLEITAIENYLGITPNVTSTWSGTFDQATTTWSSVAARIANIENGVGAAYNSRVKTIGGSTVTPSAAGVVGLTIAATSGQTANLLELRNSSNTLVTAISASGSIVAIDGGTA